MQIHAGLACSSESLLAQFLKVAHLGEIANRVLDCFCLSFLAFSVPLNLSLVFILHFVATVYQSIKTVQGH